MNPRGSDKSPGSVDAYCMLFYNEELWTKARWRGMFYDLPSGDLPRVGLLFEDPDAGATIFKEWRDRFGTVDQFDELRISFVFGSIPGQSPGYSVVLSPDVPGVVNRYISSGMRPRPHIGNSVFLELVKYHHMNTDRSPGRIPEVERFRSIYTPGTPFLFGPARRSAILSVTGVPQVVFDTSRAILKQMCFFRDAKELCRERDIEACLLPQPTEKTSRS